MVPETVARQRSDPSGSVSTVWVGCQVASRTRAATAGREAQHDLDRRLVRDDVPGRAQGRRGRAGSGGSKVRGVSAAAWIRSILNVRSASRVLVPADQVQRVGLERRLEQVRPDGRPPRRGARLVGGRRVVDRHDPALGPGPGEQPDVAR